MRHTNGCIHCQQSEFRKSAFPVVIRGTEIRPGHAYCFRKTLPKGLSWHEYFKERPCWCPLFQVKITQNKSK